MNPCINAAIGLDMCSSVWNMQLTYARSWFNYQHPTKNEQQQQQKNRTYILTLRLIFLKSDKQAPCLVYGVVSHASGTG